MFEAIGAAIAIIYPLTILSMVGMGITMFFHSRSTSPKAPFVFNWKNWYMWAEVGWVVLPQILIVIHVVKNLT